MRPLLHFTAPSGWLNDPNGLVHWNGRHHLFYQHDPDSCRPERICWGHASSTDLVTWRRHPVVLRPGEGRSGYDADGCWSGCAVPGDDAVTILYTGVRGDMQLPCVAKATGDLLETFDKDPANPVVAARPALPGVVAFRDHTVRRVDRGWRQLVGGGTRDRGGCVFEYGSPDLRRWRFERVLADATSLAIPGEVWECPDLFVVDDAAVLIVSVVDGDSQAVWWAVGEITEHGLRAGRCGRLDDGGLGYAPQSYLADDGRRLMFAWLRTHLDPGSRDDPYVGAMSLPWTVTVRSGRLHVAPARELTAARRRPRTHPVVAGTSSTEVELPDLPAVELEVPAPLAHTVRAVTCHDDRAGELLAVDLRPLHDADGDTAPLTVSFDRGIVEAFHHGRVRTASRIAAGTLSRIRLDHAAAGDGAVTSW